MLAIKFHLYGSLYIHMFEDLVVKLLAVVREKKAEGRDYLLCFNSKLNCP